MMALEVSELVVTFEYLCQTYYVSLSYFVSNERLQFEPDGLPLLVFLLKWHGFRFPRTLDLRSMS